MSHEHNQRINAIVAYMGGPSYLKEQHYPDLMDVEFELISIEDLRFDTSWDWLIPVWSKARYLLTPNMIISAIQSIDDNKIEDLFQILSQVCIQWCNEQDIKL